MGSCIIEKFGHYAELTESEKKILARLEDKKIDYKAGERVRSKGDGFDDLYIIFDGWAIVSSTLADNLRSIFDIRINGDFVGTSEMSFDHRLYDFHALTDVTVCPFPKSHLDDMFNASEKLRDIFFLVLSREQAISCERIISIGRRTAVEKVAHFILETALRFDMVGGKPKRTFDFPLKQVDIADILGLSPVHVSRAMTNLKENNYITYNRSTMTIIDEEKLLTLSGFNSQFLENTKIMENYNDALSS